MKTRRVENNIIVQLNGEFINVGALTSSGANVTVLTNGCLFFLLCVLDGELKDF